MDTIAAQIDPYGVGGYTGYTNAMEAWLGPMPQMGRMDAYEHRAVDKFNLPENYKGQNLYLGQTITDLAFVNANYMVKRILPFRPTDQLTVMWEEFEAKAHLLDTTPYQTPAHLVKQKHTMRRARLVHRNIMAEFEHNFLKTPLGRVSFLAALRQIEASVIQSAVYEGVRSLIGCHRYQDEFLRENKALTGNELKDALNRDRENFAIVQKTKNGMTKLDLNITKVMDSYGGIANAYLVPEDVSIYCTSVRPENTDYYLAGQIGPNRINSTGPGQPGADGTTPHAEPTYFVRNNDTYIVKNLHVEGMAKEEEELLTRVRQYGEYVTMIEPGVGDYTKDYRTENRAILMYNEDIDDMTRIDLEVTIDNCGLWDEDGNLRTLADYYAGGTEVSKLELDQDFLTYLYVTPNGQSRIRRPVEYLFQISKEYLDAKSVIRGGQTLYGSLVREYGQATVEAGANRAGWFNDVLGERNFIASTRSGPLTWDDVLVPLVDFPNQDRFPRQGADIVRPGGVQDIDTTGGPARIGDAFLKMMVNSAPASKQVEMSNIAGTEAPLEAKVTQMREKLVEYTASKVPGHRFPSEDKVQEFFDDRWNKCQAKMAEVPKAAAAPESRRTVQAGFPRRAEDIPAIASMIDQVRRGGGGGSSSSQRLEGSGMGLADIGAFAWAESSSDAGMRDRVDEKLKQTVNMVMALDQHLTGINASGAPLLIKQFALAYLMTSVDRESMRSLARHDALMPMNFLLLGPHHQVATKTVIKCQQDGGTGNTFIGNANFEISHEAGRMMALMHYSTHMRSVIMYPKNCWVQPDVMVVRVEGGAGCRFYTPETYKARNFDDLRDSLVCVATPITETHFPSPLDISGRFYTDYNVQLTGRNRYEPLHYSTAARYSALYEFRSNDKGSDQPSISSGRTHNNRICYQGHQQNRNPRSGNFDIITVNKGHWGKNVYAGVRDEVRNGGKEFLRQVDYTTQSANMW